MFHLCEHGQVAEVAMEKVQAINILKQERELPYAIRRVSRGAFVVGISFLFYNSVCECIEVSELTYFIYFFKIQTNRVFVHRRQCVHSISFWKLKNVAVSWDRRCSAPTSTPRSTNTNFRINFWVL